MEKMAKIFSLSLSLWGKTMTIVFKFQLLDRMLPLQNKTAWSARYLEKKKIQYEVTMYDQTIFLTKQIKLPIFLF